MSSSDGITPAKTTGGGVLTSLCISLIPATTAWFVIRGFYWWINIPVAILVLGFSAEKIYKAGANQAEVPVGWVGIGTLFGHPVWTQYAAGKHWLLKGIQGIIPVDVRPREFDPGLLEILAQDRVPVLIDGFFIGNVTDPMKYLTGVEHPDKSLAEIFESQIRLFVSQWKRAIDLILQKDLLTDFLELPADPSKDPAAYRRITDQLNGLTTIGDNPPLTPEAVTNIMADAGKFCGRAAQWGFNITEIHVEDVDLPARIKEAAEKRAAEPDVMADLQIRQRARKDMAKELMIDLNIKGQDALNAVDMLFGLAVKKSIYELSVRDYDEIAAKLGPETAAALATAASRVLKKEDE
jgi:regulator of protease activity HflC (stomatin/prohibitin superfamily)